MKPNRSPVLFADRCLPPSAASKLPARRCAGRQATEGAKGLVGCGLAKTRATILVQVFCDGVPVKMETMRYLASAAASDHLNSTGPCAHAVV